MHNKAIKTIKHFLAVNLSTKNPPIKVINILGKSINFKIYKNNNKF